ncbi:MAG: protein kinase [Planctomycetota bacterium]
MEARDQILGKLALSLGLIDQGALARAAQMVSLSGHPLERVLVEGRMIDAAGYQRLAQAFNHYLRQAHQARPQPGTQPGTHPGTQPGTHPGAPSSGPHARPGNAQHARPTSAQHARPTSAQHARPQQPPTNAAPTRPRPAPPPPPDEEDELLAQPTVVLMDSTEEEPGPSLTESAEDALLAQPTMVLQDDEGEGGGLALPDDDEDALFAEPTMVISDEGPALPDEDELLAQPTMVVRDDDDDGGRQIIMDDSSDELVIPAEFREDALLAQPTVVLAESGELEVPALDEQAILAQPTMVISDEPSEDDLYGQPTMVIKDDGLQLQSESRRGKAPSMPTPGVRPKKSGGPLDRDELQRRLKMRLGFEGFQVGDYQILGEIARGAFGVVLEVEATGVTGNLAKQRGYKGRMALKVALENKTDPHETQRFLDETRLQISFDHPHIVRIFDCGVENGLTYYSMEKIDGVEARSHVLKHGPMPALLAARVAKEVADALAYVHGRRIYHRDLKPQNVLLDQSQQPYRAVLIDFGLVVETESTKDKGLIVGTPSYMPPEQAKPRGGFGQINGTTDIYSLGATLFFFLTGQPPFSGRDPRKIIKAVIETPPPDPCALNQAIPRRIADITLKCLAKKQEERYHSAKLLAQDLEKELNKGKMKLKAKGLLGRFGLGGGGKKPST